jgi:hypothetical protein
MTKETTYYNEIGNGSGKLSEIPKRTSHPEQPTFPPQCSLALKSHLVGKLSKI